MSFHPKSRQKQSSDNAAATANKPTKKSQTTEFEEISSDACIDLLMTLLSSSEVKQPLDNSITADNKRTEDVQKTEFDDLTLDDSATQLKECFVDFVNRTDLQDFIISYMNASIAMSVCQRWKSFAENNSSRMRACHVDKIRVKCQKYQRGLYNLNISTERTPYFTSNKRTATVPLPDIMKYIRFLHTEDVIFSEFNSKSLQSIKICIPEWWKHSITKMKLSADHKQNEHVEFIKGFANLTSFDFRLDKRSRSRRPLIKVNILPYVNIMSSIKDISMFIAHNSLETDGTLDAICAKSNGLYNVLMPVAFSATALINFIKKGSFHDKVCINIYPLRGGDKDLKELNNFLTENHQSLADDIGASFNYGNSTFYIVFDS